MNASSGAEPVSLTVASDGDRVATLPAVAFGEATNYVRVPVRGEVSFRASPRGGQTAGALTDGGRFTLVAAGRSDLAIYEDGRPTGGRARIRVINSAPELGSVDARLDGRPVAERIDFTEASGYATFEPGTYDLDVTRPGGRGGALATRRGLALGAGSTVSAIVAGTGGARTRVIVVGETSVVPRKAPATGLGGLTDGHDSPWLLALLAALAAGAAGGAAYRLAARP